mgnify:CR=1 FL=1
MWTPFRMAELHLFYKSFDLGRRGSSSKAGVGFGADYGHSGPLVIIAVIISNKEMFIYP